MGHISAEETILRPMFQPLWLVPLSQDEPMWLASQLATLPCCGADHC